MFVIKRLVITKMFCDKRQAWLLNSIKVNSFVYLFNCTTVGRVSVVVVRALLFYVHGKHLRSCRDGQLT